MCGANRCLILLTWKSLPRTSHMGISYNKNQQKFQSQFAWLGNCFSQSQCSEFLLAKICGKHVNSIENLLFAYFVSWWLPGPSFARTRSRTQCPLQQSALAALEAEGGSVVVDEERLASLLDTVVHHSKHFTVERLQHLYSVLSCAIFNHRYQLDKTQVIQVSLIIMVTGSMSYFQLHW